ncbi:MAG: outer membrane protein assembly factor BamE [Clostridiales bacterium]|nr:outer membrane protein assembly factor BamE [Clostridiales bacterium]
MKHVLIALMILILSLQAFGQTPSIPSLVKRIEALEKRMQELEDKLNSLPDDSKPDDVSADKRIWRKLKRGMSEDEVRDILGEPSRVTVLGRTTVWYYEGSTIVGGDVTFSDDNLSSWSEPR